MFERCKAANTEAELQRFLKIYPHSKYAFEAEALVKKFQKDNAVFDELIASKRAIEAGTLESYAAFINQYPDSKFVPDIMARTAELQQLILDDRTEEKTGEIKGRLRPLWERLCLAPLFGVCGLSLSVMMLKVTGLKDAQIEGPSMIIGIAVGVWWAMTMREKNL